MKKAELEKKYKDYEYIFKDIEKTLGNKTLTTYEVSKQMQIAMVELFDWLEIMLKLNRVGRTKDRDGRFIWSKKQ